MRSPAALVMGLVLAMVILPCVGCGGAGKTPESIFERAKSSAQDKDYKTFVDCFTPESQDSLAKVMVQAAAGLMMLKDMPSMPGAPGGGQIAKMEALLPEVEAILERHDISSEDLSQGGGMFGMMGMGDSSEIDSIVDGIKNKPAFIGDMMDAMEELGEDAQSVEGSFVGELTEVEINGERATGKITNLPNGGDGDIEFHKTSEGWRIHLPM